MPTVTPKSPGPEPERPGLFKQLLPFVFAVGILVWVFTGLSVNVVDEALRIDEHGEARLAKHGVKTHTLVLKSTDGKRLYCGVSEGAEAAEACPQGVDFHVRMLDGAAVLLRALPDRLAPGTDLRADYVHTLSIGDLVRQLESVDLGWFIPVMIALMVIFFSSDVFGFGGAYRLFNVPDMSWREILVLRGGPYLVQVGLAPLAEVLFPLYLLRVKRVPVTHTLSSNLWTLLNDVAAIFTLLTPAVLYNLFVNTVVPVIGFEWLIGCALFWALYFSGMFFWPSERGRRLSKRTGGLMRSFTKAQPLHYLRIYAVRITVWLAFVAANYAALRAVGMDPTLPVALIGIPLIVMSIFLPIGVGGYGGPQLIAWFLLVKIGGAGTAEQAVLYSLLFSTAFLAGRAAIGLVFFRTFYNRCLRRHPIDTSQPEAV